MNISAPGASAWPPPVREGEPPLDRRDKPVAGGPSCSRFTKINKDPIPAMTTVATAIVSNGATVRITYTDGAKTVISTGGSADSGLSFGVSGSRERSSHFTADFHSGGGDDIRSERPVFGCNSTPRRADALLDGVKTENARAAVYEAAFGFAPVAGAAFFRNSLSGYSEAVEVAYSFLRRARGAWCDNTGKPLHPGQRLHGYVL